MYMILYAQAITDLLWWPLYNQCGEQRLLALHHVGFLLDVAADHTDSSLNCLATTL